MEMGGMMTIRVLPTHLYSCVIQLYIVYSHKHEHKSLLISLHPTSQQSRKAAQNNSVNCISKFTDMQHMSANYLEIITD